MPPTVDWSQFLEITRICSLCTSLIEFPLDDVDYSERPHARGDEIQEGELRKFEHHQNYAALRTSSAVCQVCQILLQWVSSRFEDVPPGDNQTPGVLKNTFDSIEPQKVMGLTIHLRRKGSVEGEFAVRLECTYEDYEISTSMMVQRSHPILVIRSKSSAPSTEESDQRVWLRPHHLDLQSRLPTVRKWLSTCLKSHEHCARSAGSILPTRLLRLRNAALGDKFVQLIESHEATGTYAILSYCWGASIPFLTTKSLLADRLDRIHIDHMPRTIQEAIHVARLLDFEYLWVDSLAIVQDDEADWQREAVRMMSYFQKAALTLLAEVSTGVDDGLFSDFAPSFIGSTSKREFALRIPSAHPNLDEHSAFDRMIYKRGWTLQETILSRRMLIFGAHTLRWGCGSEILNEDYSPSGSLSDDGPSQLGVHASTASPDMLYHSWTKILATYSSRDFTYATDRLPALAGLTQHFSLLLKDEPFLGLWRGKLLDFLLWNYGVGGRCPELKHLPSWSPISRTRFIGYMHWPIAVSSDSSSVLHDTAQIVTASLSWSSTPLISVPSAVLVLQSQAVDVDFVKYSSNLGYHPFFGTMVDFVSVNDFTVQLQLPDIEADYCGTLTLLKIGSMYCSKLSSFSLGDVQEGVFYRILVLLSHGSVGTYRRVGTGLARRSDGITKDIFQGAEKRVVNLV